MNAAPAQKYAVLCVDDNPHVADALRAKFCRQHDCTWLGCLPEATHLIDRVRAKCPEIVVLDLDMPGSDPLDVLQQLCAVCPETRTIIFSGHVRKDLIDRAIDAGAWGYVSKNEDEDVLFDTVDRVLHGEFTLSPQVRAVLDG